MSKKSTKTTAAATATPTKKVKIAKRSATPQPAEAKVTAAAKSAGPSRNRSVDEFGDPPHRMGIMEYQDFTFTQQATRKLSDEELCTDWQKQFPGAVTFQPFHVVGARRDFNNGRHSKKFPKPSTPVSEYRDRKPVVAEQKSKAA